jgi:hypothetical protein
VPGTITGAIVIVSIDLGQRAVQLQVPGHYNWCNCNCVNRFGTGSGAAAGAGHYN